MGVREADAPIDVAERPTVARSIAETACTNVVLGALGVATGVIAARWLGPEGRGELAAIQMWPTTLAWLAMMGLPHAVIYFSAQHPGESKRYLVTALVTGSAVMPIFAVAGYYLMPLLVSAQPDRVVQGARVYLLVLPVSLLFAVPHHVLRGVQHYRLWNVLRVVPALLWVAVVVGAAALQITDPVVMTTTYIVLFAVIGVVAFWTVWKWTVGPSSPTASAFFSLMKFGLPAAFSTLPQVFSVRLDQMVVAALLPPRQLGLYAAAVAWTGGTAMMSTALAVIVSTQIAANASEDEKRYLFNRGVNAAVWVITVPVVVLSAIAPFGVNVVFGREFAEAAAPAMILVVASGMNAFNVVLEELLRGFGKPGATFWAESTAAGVSLTLLLYLLPHGGLVAASVASLVGSFAATSVLVIYGRRNADLNIWTALDPRGFKWADVSARATRALSFRLG